MYAAYTWWCVHIAECVWRQSKYRTSRTRSPGPVRVTGTWRVWWGEPWLTRSSRRYVVVTGRRRRQPPRSRSGTNLQFVFARHQRLTPRSSRRGICLVWDNLVSLRSVHSTCLFWRSSWNAASRSVEWIDYLRRVESGLILKQARLHYSVYNNLSRCPMKNFGEIFLKQICLTTFIRYSAITVKAERYVTLRITVCSDLSIKDVKDRVLHTKKSCWWFWAKNKYIGGRAWVWRLGVTRELNRNQITQIRRLRCC